MLVELSKQRQVTVTGGQDIHLKIWAYRGSLGVSMNVAEARMVIAAMVAAIVQLEAPTIDLRASCK